MCYPNGNSMALFDELSQGRLWQARLLCVAEAERRLGQPQRHSHISKWHKRANANGGGIPDAPRFRNSKLDCHARYDRNSLTSRRSSLYAVICSLSNNTNRREPSDPRPKTLSKGRIPLPPSSSPSSPFHQVQQPWTRTPNLHNVDHRAHRDEERHAAHHAPRLQCLAADDHPPLPALQLHIWRQGDTARGGPLGPRPPATPRGALHGPWHAPHLRGHPCLP